MRLTLRPQNRPPPSPSPPPPPPPPPRLSPLCIPATHQRTAQPSPSPSPSSCPPSSSTPADTCPLDRFHNGRQRLIGNDQQVTVNGHSPRRISTLPGSLQSSQFTSRRKRRARREHRI
ncbi:hypothetical protein PLESTM_000496900 [Pleodorina starrii]|nr:hypothetical protein PLESTM_000496900 [Pleodorina starrii]